MVDSPMAQTCSLSLSYHFDFKRNSFKIFENALARIKVPGLFYVKVQGFKGLAKSAIQRGVLKWPRY